MSTAGDGTVRELIRRHKRGEAIGITSVCSAHPWVIEATMRECLSNNQLALIEATSNQVNQFGGYTGMTPARFMAFTQEIASRVGLPPNQLQLGGDHLGPNAWQSECAVAAMAKATDMVRQYVSAGFRKIHLDCSMSCADDPSPLPEVVVAARAVALVRVAEAAWAALPVGTRGEAPAYVVGTEVPVPGGAQDDLLELAVTRVVDAATTIAVHEQAFADAKLGDAWTRVIALVVQPGVEFDHYKVIDYMSTKAQPLSAFIARHPTLVCEAHSTDYQTPQALQALVRDHFAVLKVGPGVTFALREAFWGLADLAREWLGADRAIPLKQLLLDAMRNDSSHWRNYYAVASNLHIDLQFSLSDRIRYYWALPEVQRACLALSEQLESAPPPLALISQYLPRQYDAVREGRIDVRPHALVQEAVAGVLRPYLQACAPLQ